MLCSGQEVAMQVLSADRIEAAALALVEEGGPAHLTMRRLAERLGVEAPSLYHHVPNKAAVVDRLVDAVIALAPAPPSLEDPQAHLLALTAGWRDLLRAHPQALALIGARPLAWTTLLDRTPASHTLLLQAGLSAAQARSLLQGLLILIVGQEDLCRAGGARGDEDGVVRALIAGGLLAVRVEQGPAVTAAEPAPTAHGPPAPHMPARPAAEPARRGLASRLIRRAGHLLGADED
jgi:AcrR family transcriptional regulator